MFFELKWKNGEVNVKWSYWNMKVFFTWNFLFEKENFP